MSRRNVSATAAFALLLFASLHAQRPTSATGTARQTALPLTVDSIMRGPDLVGSAPSSVRWSGDSRAIYFEWQKPGEDEASTYIVAREGGEPRKLSDEEARKAPPAGGRWDKARRRLLAVDGGDVIIYDRAANTRRQLTKTDGNEGSPRWTRNDTAITFVQGGNLYVMAVDGAGTVLTQLTNIGPRRADPALSESQRVLRDEEQKLLDIVRERAERRKQSEAEREKEALPRLEINARQTVGDIQLSPDGRYAWVSVTERPATPGRSADVPNYVTDSAYAEMIPARTNVGDAQSRSLLAVIDLQDKKAVWADASFAPSTGKNSAGRELPREVSWTMAELSGDGRHAVAAVRSTDNKDRWLVAVDPASGKSRVIDHLHDEAWVRASGVIGSSGAGGFGAGVAFLPDNKRAAFLSERDGWMHLYTVDLSAADAKPVQLTSGSWEIEQARLSADGTKFFISSTEAHPGERHAYVMSADGGARTRLTTATGAHDLTISPDETAAADVYSYATKPPELYVIPQLAPGAGTRQVTTTPTEEWRAFKWIDPKLVTYKTRDGKEVYARLYTPEMIVAKRDPLKPAVVFVHGDPRSGV
jgi:dipeptidyl aminopeptidase/acylaminoacyl peptidase